MEHAKKRIGVVRGGKDEHFATSLRRGGDIITYIFENLSDKYNVCDILIDKKGIWHINGLPIIPADLAHRVDMVWNTAHSGISVILDNFAIPNVGTGAFSSIFLGNLPAGRQVLREHMSQIGVQMPRSIILPVYQEDFDGPQERYSIKRAKEIHQKFAPPWVIRSLDPTSEMAVHLAHTFNELVAGIEDGVKQGESILVEEFIVGKVASIHSVPGFRGEEIYIFPPVNVFGNLSGEEKEKLTSIAEDLHQHVGSKHYLRSNFVLSKRGAIYLLDLDFTPNLKSFSHFSQACESVGAKPYHVVEHILEKVM